MAQIITDDSAAVVKPWRLPDIDGGEPECSLQEDKTFDPDLLAKIIKTLEAPMLLVTDEVETEIMLLIEVMLEKLVRRDLNLNPEKLKKVVKNALELLPVKNNDVKIFVSVQDYESQLGQLKDLAGKIIADPKLHKGDFKISINDEIIDGTVAQRVKEVVKQRREDNGNDIRQIAL